HDVRQPLPTVTGSHGMAIAAPYLVPRHGEREGQAARCRAVGEPLPTVTGTANGAQLVAAFLSHFYTSNTRGGQGDPRQPAKTITSGGQHT
ncbi:MAG: DNA cytosine methyltransferase, partial [Pseudomonadota bacterium]